jgi:UV DNA damage endonuclease
MRLGYPCINRSIGCTANSTFRLASYSRDLLIEKVANNLNCLERILQFNLEHGLFFFRISSDIVPFASHPVCKVDWAKHFSREFLRIGRFIKEDGMRISMHPDQFVLINAIDGEIVKRSIAELAYHARVLDAMKLGTAAKIQIHVGGVYGDKEAAIERFARVYRELPQAIRRRLAVENDDKLFSLADCLIVHKKTGVPIIFDSFHHECLNNGEPLRMAIEAASNTWKKRDGIPMMDYSSQKRGARKGTHVDHINVPNFKKFLGETRGLDFDLMLEIKDKEKSALKAHSILRSP